MLVNVEMIGWGVFRVGEDRRLYVWDDYPDDDEHAGYGVMVPQYKGDGWKEIVRLVRDERENVVQMDLVDFDWEVSEDDGN